MNVDNLPADVAKGTLTHRSDGYLIFYKSPKPTEAIKKPNSWKSDEKKTKYPDLHGGPAQWHFVS